VNFFSFLFVLEIQYTEKCEQVVLDVYRNRSKMDISIDVITEAERIDKILAGSRDLEMNKDWKELDAGITYDIKA
jgi:hypothetical protein